MFYQELLESDYNRRKYVMCRDEAGVGLLHKAVFYDYMDIAEYLVKNYPQLVHQKDSVSSFGSLVVIFKRFSTCVTLGVYACSFWYL